MKKNSSYLLVSLFLLCNVCSFAHYFSAKEKKSRQDISGPILQNIQIRFDVFGIAEPTTTLPKLPNRQHFDVSVFLSPTSFSQKINIPNIFSPNGDGVNDTWIIADLVNYRSCIVEIYNRYGQLVFRLQGYKRPWDGKTVGRAVPVGTYYYLIDLKNGQKKISGYVDVIR